MDRSEIIRSYCSSYEEIDLLGLFNDLGPDYKIVAQSKVDKRSHLFRISGEEKFEIVLSQHACTLRFFPDKDDPDPDIEFHYDGISVDEIVWVVLTRCQSIKVRADIADVLPAVLEWLSSNDPYNSPFEGDLPQDPDEEY